MKRAVAAAFAGLLLLAAARDGAAENAFLGQVEDLPLMPGLVEVADAGVAFDKPAGRIVEAYAGGRVSPQAVLAFYRETLPQLGWRPVGPGSYRRGGEVLRLTATAAAGGATVHFSLAPE